MVTRLLTGVVFASLALLAAAPGATAQAARPVHTEHAAQPTLTGSDPAEGATLDTAPRKITLTFSEPVEPELVVILVTGGDGHTWRVGEISASGNTVTMPVTPSGPAGRCTADYFIADETHPVRGEIRFTLAKPAPSSAPEPTSAQAAPDPITNEPDDSGGIPMWLWLALGAVLLGVAVGVVISGFMRARGSDGP